jgi:asparagine synthase (glutamine-hydrolysing)
MSRMLACSPVRGAPESVVDGGFALGIQRLGDDASLAMSDRLVVSVEGYIANWADLCRPTLGPNPPEESDASRLRRLIECDGEAVLPELRGEFAILIFHRAARRVVALRDAVGVKQLFYQQLDGAVFIGTEVRQVLSGSGQPGGLHFEAMVGFLLDRHVISPEESLTEGVSRMLPAFIHEFSGDRGAVTAGRRRYWVLPASGKPRARFDPQAAAAEFRERFRLAVRRAAPAGHFGVSMSGGLDSSSIWAEVKVACDESRVPGCGGQPYSVVFPGSPCDERPLIEAILAWTGSEGVFIDGADERFSDHGPAIAAVLDSPQFPTDFIHLLVAARLRSNGGRVLLSGLGADQVLGGDYAYLREDLEAGRVGQYLSDVKDLMTAVNPRRAARLALRAAVTALLGRSLSQYCSLRT